jgi:hypothetical protein
MEIPLILHFLRRRGEKLVVVGHAAPAPVGGGADRTALPLGIIGLVAAPHLLTSNLDPTNMNLQLSNCQSNNKIINS